ncbi:MAG: GGDEF and EAL domain-containing protein [Ruminococcus sp.]|nr:GGDEF and EAL domain-containing protein [Ruminococcus sp.]
MNNRNSITIAFIMAAATSFVIFYAYIKPELAFAILSVFLITVTILWIALAVFKIVTNSNLTTVDISEITSITENLNTEIIIWTDDCSAVFMNKRLRDLLNINSTEFDHKEVLCKVFNIDSVTPEICERLHEKQHDTQFESSTGKTTSIIWSTSLFKKNKKTSLYISTGFNLTEIKSLQSNLKSANDCFALSMELSEIGVLMSRDDSHYYASPEITRMLGLKSDTISFDEFRSYVHPNDRIHYDSCFKWMNSVKHTASDVKNLEMRMKTASGSYRWFSYRFKVIQVADNTFPVFGGAFLDITHDREKDLIIERLAYLDEVTEISNRNKLLKTGQETYDCGRMLEYSYWVIVLDIDRFHIVNDTCGYDNGNKLLRDFAHMLYKYVSPGGLAARISGDNFALILRDYGDNELPARTFSAIQEDLSRLAVNEYASLNLSCSAGYSRMPDDGNSFLDILEHAEFALKSNSRQGNICAYEHGMHDSIIGNSEMEKALSDAIDNNELQLFYQPKISLSTGKIVGVEALVRWIKPDGTIVQPGSFVPIAEGSHLIGRISEFVLNEACRQNMLWQRMGFPQIIMSINFASSDFYQKDLRDKVFEALARSGLKAKWLEVELTESLALRDIDFAVSQMNSLRDLGVKLAMDDFGTGYSSLSYLQILPITLLKLDRSFITDIESDNIAYEIVSAVIRIAKSKKIETIAEGIENETQADILRKAGCDFAQGYLYGKPMPPEDIPAFFEKNNNQYK